MSEAAASPREAKPKVWILLAVLLGVLGIGGVVLLVVVPAALMSARDKALLVKCASQTRQHALALVVHQTERGALPKATGVEALQLFIKDERFDASQAFCPGQPAPSGPLTAENCGYVVLSLEAPKQPSADFPVSWCKAAHPSGQRNMAFADGHVETLDAEAFERRLAAATETFGPAGAPR